MDQRLDRGLFVVTLLLACASLLFALRYDHVRWIATSGLLFDIAGILQLKTSDYFAGILDRHLERDTASTRFARWGSDEPKQAISARLRNQLFFDGQTGFAFLVFGSILQLLAIWLPNLM